MAFNAIIHCHKLFSWPYTIPTTAINLLAYWRIRTIERPQACDKAIADSCRLWRSTYFCYLFSFIPRIFLAALRVCLLMVCPNMFWNFENYNVGGLNKSIDFVSPLWFYFIAGAADELRKVKDPHVITTQSSHELVLNTVDFLCRLTNRASIQGNSYH